MSRDCQFSWTDTTMRCMCNCAFDQNQAARRLPNWTCQRYYDTRSLFTLLEMPDAASVLPNKAYKPARQKLGVPYEYVQLDNRDQMFISERCLVAFCTHKNTPRAAKLLAELLAQCNLFAHVQIDLPRLDALAEAAAAVAPAAAAPAAVVAAAADLPAAAAPNPPAALLNLPALAPIQGLLLPAQPEAEAEGKRGRAAQAAAAVPDDDDALLDGDVDMSPAPALADAAAAEAVAANLAAAADPAGDDAVPVDQAPQTAADAEAARFAAFVLSLRARSSEETALFSALRKHLPAARRTSLAAALSNHQWRKSYTTLTDTAQRTALRSAWLTLADVLHTRTDAVHRAQPQPMVVDSQASDGDSSELQFDTSSINTPLSPGKFAVELSPDDEVFAAALSDMFARHSLFFLDVFASLNADTNGELLPMALRRVAPTLERDLATAGTLLRLTCGISDVSYHEFVLPLYAEPSRKLGIRLLPLLHATKAGMKDMAAEWPLFPTLPLPLSDIPRGSNLRSEPLSWRRGGGVGLGLGAAVADDGDVLRVRMTTASLNDTGVLVDVVDLVNKVLLKPTVWRHLHFESNAQPLVISPIFDARQMWRGLQQTLGTVKFPNMTLASFSVLAVLPVLLYRGGDSYAELRKHGAETARSLARLTALKGCDNVVRPVEQVAALDGATLSAAMGNAGNNHQNPHGDSIASAKESRDDTAFLPRSKSDDWARTVGAALPADASEAAVKAHARANFGNIGVPPFSLPLANIWCGPFHVCLRVFLTLWKRICAHAARTGKLVTLQSVVSAVVRRKVTLTTVSRSGQHVINIKGNLMKRILASRNLFAEAAKKGVFSERAAETLQWLLDTLDLKRRLMWTTDQLLFDTHWASFARIALTWMRVAKAVLGDYMVVPTLRREVDRVPLYMHRCYKEFRTTYGAFTEEPSEALHLRHKRHAKKLTAQGGGKLSAIANDMQMMAQLVTFDLVNENERQLLDHAAKKLARRAAKHAARDRADFAAELKRLCPQLVEGKSSSSSSSSRASDSKQAAEGSDDEDSDADEADPSDANNSDSDSDDDELAAEVAALLEEEEEDEGGASGDDADEAADAGRESKQQSAQPAAASSGDRATTRANAPAFKALTVRDVSHTVGTHAVSGVTVKGFYHWRRHEIASENRNVFTRLSFENIRALDAVEADDGTVTVTIDLCVPPLFFDYTSGKAKQTFVDPSAGQSAACARHVLEGGAQLQQLVQQTKQCASRLEDAKLPAAAPDFDESLYHQHWAEAHPQQVDSPLASNEEKALDNADAARADIAGPLKRKCNVCKRLIAIDEIYNHASCFPEFVLHPKPPAASAAPVRRQRRARSDDRKRAADANDSASADEGEDEDGGSWTPPARSVGGESKSDGKDAKEPERPRSQRLAAAATVTAGLFGCFCGESAKPGETQPPLKCKECKLLLHRSCYPDAVPGFVWCYNCRDDE